MGKYCRLVIILLVFFSIVTLSAQRRQRGGDNISVSLPTIAEVDSLRLDSAAIADSIQSSITREKKESPFKDVVSYKAKDSLIFTGNNFAHMFGSSTITYQEIQLDADRLTMDMDSSNVFAFGGEVDSSGVQAGKPKFKDKGGEYESETMKYNFVSQKGYITNVVTTQGEGYVTGGVTKKMANNDLYMMGGKYTTCDDHEHPHFYFALSRAKVSPGKNIVTGPAHFVLEDVHLPLAIPFGFFPFSSDYSSGLIFPAFGEELNRGFFLRNGGYYFALSDYMDLALTGELYTKGSWGLNAQSAYVKKYKYSGSFNLGYLVTVTGDKGLPDYSKGTDFKINWTHTQDSKSNPSSTFSASVNLSSSTYDRKQMDSYYNPNNFTNNTKSSSVSYSYRFPTIPLNVAANMNVNQRTKDSAIAVTLPDVTLTLSRIYPFKRRMMVGAERWYEKIAMSYNGQFRNSIDTKENKLMQSSLARDWKNGAQHAIPVSATFSLLKNISITPSIDYRERWYKEKIVRDWDPMASAERLDTIGGFNRVYNYSFNVGLSTKLYGFFKPWKLFGDKIQMIRHVFTPSVTYSLTPDFGDPKYGFWSSYSYTDAQGTNVTRDYSYYDGMLFGTAPRGKQSLVNFSVQNNVEMKLRPKEGEEEEESSGNSPNKNKISLIDNLTAGISYNAVADSMNWSNIRSSLRLKLSEKFSMNVSGEFDTYTYDVNSGGSPVRVNKMRIAEGKGLGRLSMASTSFSYNLSDETFKKKEKREKSSDDELDEEEEYQNELDSLMNNSNPMAPMNPDDPRLSFKNKKDKKGDKEGEFDEDGYTRLGIKWGVNFNYSLSYAYADFNTEIMEYNRKLTHNLGFSANLDITKNWRFNLSSSWDFDQNKLAMMTCNLSRNLHCFTLTASFVPIGPYQSYFFTIAVNSSLLKDLKWDKRSSPYDARSWY